MSDTQKSFQDVVRGICLQDNRFHHDAYLFVVEALDMTVKRIRKEQPEHGHHVTGQELSEGIRDLALHEFGPMASIVLVEWGVHKTSDFGTIVYNLIEAGRLGKTESDNIDDFTNVFDFNQTFVKPFEPVTPLPPPPARPARRRKRE